MGERQRASGDFYEGVDEFKLLAMAASLETAHNIDRLGIKEISASRGESAQAIDYGELAQFHGAFVNEELGTKNLVADEMYKITGHIYDFQVGIDVAAAQFNDLITVGADPVISQAHFIAGSRDWFNNSDRNQELVRGYADGCNQAGANWMGGETGLLEGIVEPGRVALSGSASGIIHPKTKLTSADYLSPGDCIIYLPSSGIHANGLTDVRDMLAQSGPLLDGYTSFLRDGTMLGETLLTPAPIYADAVRSLYEAGVDIHYMSNITGHGWRKLMRADRELTYRISLMPENPPELFAFIKRNTGKTDEQMYATFNMGMGFAIYIGRDHLMNSLKTLQSRGWPARLAGSVQEGPKQVIIEPKDIVFTADDLQIR